MYFNGSYSRKQTKGTSSTGEREVQTNSASTPERRKTRFLTDGQQTPFLCGYQSCEAYVPISEMPFHELILYNEFGFHIPSHRCYSEYIASNMC